MEKYEKLTWKEYMSLSIRTLPRLGDGNIWATHDLCSDEETKKHDITLDRIHCAMGIVSETQELIDAIDNNDVQNIGEEICDASWYLSALLYVNNNYQINADFNYNINEYTDFLIESKHKTGVKYEIEYLHRLNHSIIDSAKKELAYNTENKIGINLITDYLVCLQKLAFKFDINLEEALAKNINKLYVRYPEKFTNENAINRDLDKEKEVL